MTRLLITWPTSLHNNEVDIREQHDAASQVQLLSIHINFELYRRLRKVMNPVHSHMHTTWQVLLHFCYFLCTSLSWRELTGQVGCLVRPGGNKERQNTSTKWRIIIRWILLIHAVVVQHYTCTWLLYAPGLYVIRISACYRVCTVSFIVSQTLHYWSLILTLLKYSGSLVLEFVVALGNTYPPHTHTCTHTHTHPHTHNTPLPLGHLSSDMCLHFSGILHCLTAQHSHQVADTNLCNVFGECGGVGQI